MGTTSRSGHFLVAIVSKITRDNAGELVSAVIVEMISCVVLIIADQNFNIRELSADKAYSSLANLRVVAAKQTSDTLYPVQD